MNIGPYLSIFGKIYGLIKSILWKNKNIVYINGNVKPLNKESIRHLITPSDSKYIDCQSTKKNSLSLYKKHFKKQKICLFQINRNIRDFSKITYGGFSSQIFSIFDGYILGDTNNYDFIEIDEKNNYYLILEKKKFVKESFDIDDSLNEINLIIETSYIISIDKCLNKPTIIFNEHAPSKITNDYLNKVYSFVKNVLDSCGSKKINKVNLYLSAKQSVAFIIGTAIQGYHPNIRVFNYDNNEFNIYLDIKKGVIKELYKNGK